MSAYPDGPPLGHTGGFGEPTCQACHAGEPLNTPGGELSLDLPERYEPGRSYEIGVRLHRSGLTRAGFEISLRLGDGTQAGVLETTAPELVNVARFRDLIYGFHKRPGTVVAGETGRWTLRWTAPAADSVMVHVAAVAANDDNSNLGDWVYAASAVLRPR